jgi:hypothetical protein
MFRPLLCGTEVCTGEALLGIIHRKFPSPGTIDIEQSCYETALEPSGRPCLQNGLRLPLSNEFETHVRGSRTQYGTIRAIGRGSRVDYCMEHKKAEARTVGTMS